MIDSIFFFFLFLKLFWKIRKNTRKVAKKAENTFLQKKK